MTLKLHVRNAVSRNVFPAEINVVDLFHRAAWLTIFAPHFRFTRSLYCNVTRPLILIFARLVSPSFRRLQFNPLLPGLVLFFHYFYIFSFSPPPLSLSRARVRVLSISLNLSVSVSCSPLAWPILHFIICAACIILANSRGEINMQEQLASVYLTFHNYRVVLWSLGVLHFAPKYSKPPFFNVNAPCRNEDSLTRGFSPTYCSMKFPVRQYDTPRLQQLGA